MGRILKVLLEKVVIIASFMRTMRLSTILSLLVFVLFVSVFAFAQDALEAYNSGRLTEALHLFEEGSLNPDEADFLRAAMTADADSAVEIYRQIVLRSPESDIAQQALERIRQYYYAQGVYSRAEEIGKTLGNQPSPVRHLRTPESTPPPPFILAPSIMPRPPAQQKPEQVLKESNPQPEIKPPAPLTYDFYLQVGAFSSPANAESFEETFDKAGYNTVIEPPAEGSRLYLVKITGYGSIEEAFQAAEEIKRQFGIQPIVNKKKE